MSVNTGNIRGDLKARDSERAGRPITGVSTDLTDKKIKVRKETLNAQISTLTQLLNQLIQDNSARNSPTTGPRTQRKQREPAHCKIGTSKALPETATGSTGSPLDMVTGVSCTKHRRPPTLDVTETDDQIFFLARHWQPECSPLSEVTELYDFILNTITTLWTRISAINTSTKLLHTHILTIRVDNDRFNDFERLLKNHLRSFSNRVTKEVKLQCSQNLLRRGH